MFRHCIIFVIFFSLGAVAAIAIRTSLHHPYTVSGSVTAEPTMEKGLAVTPSSSPSPSDKQVPVAVDAFQPVNTICAICGMEVNPALPTALYQQKIIGFGCKACPANFAKDPEKFGPAALRNEVVE